MSYNFEAPGLGVNVPVIPHSEGSYLFYQENATSLEAFAVFEEDAVNLIADGEPRQLRANRVTREHFDVLRVRPLLGRALVEGEDRPGAEPVAILGYALWEESFGRDPDVIGRLVEMDGVMRRIVGIMPREALLSDEELWLPLEIDDTDPDEGSLQYVGIARLADGSTIESADAEMETLLLRYSDAHPDELGREIIEQAGLYVANLFLVRAEARQRERAVRTALGAGRGDVIRQYLSEGLALAIGAGLLGLGLAAFGVKGLLALAPAEVPGPSRGSGWPSGSWEPGG